MKKKAKVIKIKASCGSQGCDLQPYIMPFGNKSVKFTQYPAKKLAA